MPPRLSCPQSLVRGPWYLVSLFGHFSGRIESNIPLCPAPAWPSILHILNDCHGLMCSALIGSRAEIDEVLLKLEVGLIDIHRKPEWVII